MTNKDRLKQEYEEFRQRFQGQRFQDFRSGEWFASFVKWVLEEYSRRVDAAYIRKIYPGAGPRNQSAKARQVAARYASIVGSLSASIITGMELGGVATVGANLPIAVPAIGTAIMADLALTVRAQLRCTYDLSVIYGTPLSLDDIEDCYLIFLLGIGIKVSELTSGVAKSVGPKIVAYNARKILRRGVRSFLQTIIKRVAGTQIARKLTERTLMRVLVPGISIPISASMNYYFTRTMLQIADEQMRLRGASVQPILRLYKAAPNFPRELVVKTLIAVMEAPDRPGWEMNQLDVLRHTQSALKLTDEDVAALEEWFEKDVGEVVNILPDLPSNAAAALVDYLAVAAALGSDESHDAQFALAIEIIARRYNLSFEVRRLGRLRRDLR